MSKNSVKLYSTKAHVWFGSKTMEHASGIWGRTEMFRYLKSRIKKDDNVIDLGCGAGYPTYVLGTFIGNRGSVCGVDNCREFIIEANEKYLSNNIKFVHKDISNMSFAKDKSIDVFVSFMTLHNLNLLELENTVFEIMRCLKDGGFALFLTLHPDIFESEWSLDFIEYNIKKVLNWKQEKTQDMYINGKVKNKSGGFKKVFMFTRKMSTYLKLLKKSGFKITFERDIYIDRETTEKYFGINKKRIYPKSPIFWMFELKKVV